jgi:hypothetical protein
MSRAERRKAPVASSIERPAALVTSRAAPGVDQAVTTGIRYRSERSAQVRPIPSPRASIHEPTWAVDAPTAPAAWKTITAELAKPTSTVTKPAATAEMDRSRRMVMRPRPL